MTRENILITLFILGIVIYSYKIIKEYIFGNGKENYKSNPYKFKYYTLMLLLFISILFNLTTE